MYEEEDFVIMTAAGHDIGPRLVGTVVECAAACCDGFDGVACYGFSRSKAAADDVASDCWFKGATPEADRRVSHLTYHTFHRALDSRESP
jgi:hypothetical protein